jgi:hypothetical protein
LHEAEALETQRGTAFDRDRPGEIVNGAAGGADQKKIAVDEIRSHERASFGHAQFGGCGLYNSNHRDSSPDTLPGHR